MVRRDEFLKSIWVAYPKARSNWFDVSEFLAGQKENSRSALVAGRLIKHGADSWILSSNGSQLQFRFSDHLAWLESQRGSSLCNPEWFQVGDLVCIEIEMPNTDTSPGIYHATRVLLLAPGQSARQAQRSFDVQRSVQWMSFTQAIREFFIERGFTECLTPTLVPSPGTEPFLDPFRTEWAFGQHKNTYYLPTSPEFHLKQMLASGWTRIFEIKTCFRNGEISEHHQPEFSMLEWYRAYRDLDAIADDVEELFAFLAKAVARLQPGARSSSTLPRLKRVTMADLFFETFEGFQLRPTTTREELIQLANRFQVKVEASDSWDDVFFRLFLERIESQLGKDGPLLVRGYPPSQAALSRIGNDGFSDRFEVYWHGLELANAFHELNDPDENVRRFQQDSAQKSLLGKAAVPVDQNLVESLYSGMPPSGGIALGVDRLFMAFYNLKSISEARAFPVRAP